MKRILCCLMMLSALGMNAQYAGPDSDFAPPLDIPLILAGTFGELRSNHFHSGIDIKTQQRQGLPVYAIAEGTVSRVKVSHWGYGKALYISHPNGYTSVYAHLQKFSPEIDEYVKKLQYSKQSYEVEAFPEYGTLKVAKGSVIAYSGNTGGSSGPHLHFEVRSSLDEKPTNPLLYNFEVRDATNPVLEKVYVYPLSEKSQVNQSAEKIEIPLKRQADGSYLADTVYADGNIGFGIVAFDRQDMAANKNGVFRIEQRVNGKTYTRIDFDKFSFGETRLINTLIDYPHYYKYRDRIQKCFRAAGNKLSLFEAFQNNGEIAIRPGLSYQVELELSDVAGNRTLVRIPVEGKKQAVLISSKDSITSNFILASKPHSFSAGSARVYFPADTFYENFYLQLSHSGDTLYLHNPSVPAHRNFTITYEVSKYSPEERRRLFVARLGRNNRLEYERTYKRGNTFNIRSRELGSFVLAQDTIPPKISPKNFKENQWLTNYRYLSLKISDDLSGIESYSATLNGKWILMEYEPKTNTITYNFDDQILNERQCRLKVEVTDNVGNSSEFTANFYRR
ncbi:M23 family metallopeptidase [Robiginitalea sp. IMCC43444]|uniref:M23 family metallopeptidase n=1 Tax=Robiginitalea sp. IMCC43444 TaxID=3459121 RepID=UPI004041E324